jgi:hypothetical protein
MNKIELTIEQLGVLVRGATTPLACITSSDPQNLGQSIVVLDRGFVFVGDTVIDGDFVKVTNCKNIRYWGTKNGLGELRNGPLAETKLDAVGEMKAPLKSLIFTLPCKGF